MDFLYQIIAKHMCAGLILREERVIQTPPILRYMNGWEYEKVLNYTKKKGWKLISTERSSGAGPR